MEIVHEYFACWPIMGKTDAKFWLDNRDSLESIVLLKGHFFSLNHGQFFQSKQGGWKRETIVTKEALSCHFTMKRTVLTTWIKTKLQLLLTLVLIYVWCRLKENNSISWTFSCSWSCCTYIFQNVQFLANDFLWQLFRTNNKGREYRKISKISRRNYH